MKIGKTSSMLSFLDGNQYSYPRSFSSPHSTYSEGTSSALEPGAVSTQSVQLKGMLEGKAPSWRCSAFFLLCSLKKQLVSVSSGLKGQWVLYSLKVRGYV